MGRRQVAALVTPQWWPEWEKIDWAQSGHPGGPVRGFLVFSMAASELRQLSGVFRRDPRSSESRASDTNVQRPHEEGRSREIRRFVERGYPQSNMAAKQLAKSPDSDRRPGWLPTAIVVNVLAPGETRDGLDPLPEDLRIEVAAHEWSGGTVTDLSVPIRTDADTGEGQLVPPTVTPPLEVIDGQHRLWAFEEEDDTPDFFVPVVAFVELSKAFQAYLFWSINIKPKKINTSLAFDLYPVLRSQEWLMQGEGLKVYRESRAQELTEALWVTARSPWFERINMIGATGVSEAMPVTQASFVRALMASFIRPWEPSGSRSLSGGLFSSDDSGGLDWNRSQQAAFLIASWSALVSAAETVQPDWLKKLRAEVPDAEVLSRYTLLGTDQGVRAYSLITNELAYKLRDEVGLRTWRMAPSGDSVDTAQVADALDSLRDSQIAALLQSIADLVIKFDWRSSRFVENASERESLEVFRGSGGYVRLRARLYELLAEGADGDLREASEYLLRRVKDELDDA
jgi:DGQHR domain-containing protein